APTSWIASISALRAGWRCPQRPSACGQRELSQLAAFRQKHDIGGLDQCRRLLADGQAQLVAALARNQGRHFIVSDLDSDLGSRLTLDYLGNGSRQAIASTDLHGLHPLFGDNA